MQSSGEERTDEPRDGAEEGEIENDAPGGFLHVAQFFNLPVDDEINEADGKA